jgi:hypothetical protein
MNNQVHEIKRDDSKLTNHQRIKDREMQRAFDAGAEVTLLPTKSRARRAGTTQKRIIEEQRNAASLSMHDSPDN